ncbi:MAG: NfeD family protein [Candidatus Dormibacteraceae bacterium]
MALIWIVIALLLVVAEVVTVALFALFLSLGAVGAAVAAFAGFSLLPQALAFAGVSAAGILLLRPLLLLFKKRRSSASGAGEMIGQSAIVVRTTEGADRLGHVRLDGEDWPARRRDGQSLIVDSKVSIIALEGATLIVDPIGE